MISTTWTHALVLIAKTTQVREKFQARRLVRAGCGDARRDQVMSQRVGDSIDESHGVPPRSRRRPRGAAQDVGGLGDLDGWKMRQGCAAKLHDRDDGLPEADNLERFRHHGIELMPCYFRSSEGRSGLAPGDGAARRRLPKRDRHQALLVTSYRSILRTRRGDF
jgi:hypothetical protein